MTADPVARDAVTLWQNQPLGREHMSVDEVRHRLTRMEARVLRWRVWQSIAFLIVLGGMTWAVWRLPAPMMRIGAGIIAATALGAIARSFARRRDTVIGEGLTSATCREFLLAALTSRRKAAQHALWWQVAPFAGGMAVFLIGMYMTNRNDWQLPAAFWIVASFQTGIARWRLERAMRSYDREITALSLE